MDRKELKIQALLQKIGTMSSSYEDAIANLRVELTIVTQALDEANAQIKTFESKTNESTEDS